jgi:hypothetical protein
VQYHGKTWTQANRVPALFRRSATRCQTIMCGCYAWRSPPSQCDKAAGATECEEKYATLATAVTRNLR